MLYLFFSCTELNWRVSLCELWMFIFAALSYSLFEFVVTEFQDSWRGGRCAAVLSVPGARRKGGPPHPGPDAPHAWRGLPGACLGRRLCLQHGQHFRSQSGPHVTVQQWPPTDLRASSVSINRRRKQLTSIDSFSQLTSIDSYSQLTPIDLFSQLTPIDLFSRLTPIDFFSRLTPIDFF